MPQSLVLEAPVAQAPPLAQVVFSRLLGGISGHNARSTHLLCKTLAIYAATGLVSEGRVLAAPAPDMPLGPWPDGGTALTRRGTSIGEVRGDLAARSHQWGQLATLDTELLEELFPPRLWPVVMLAAADGPATFVVRSERALTTIVLTDVPANKRRANGPPSLNYVRAFQTSFARLAATFVALRSHGCPYPELEEWTAAARPRISVQRSLPTREVRAPRVELVRMAWKTLDEHLRAGLRVDAEDDLYTAVAAARPSQLRSDGLFRRFRRLLALELFTLLGGRCDAILRLNRSDFVRDHIGPPPDRRCGAVLLLRPGKSLPLDLVRPKPIPEGLARLIDAYLLFLDRQRAALFDAPPSFDPRRPPTREFTADPPLLLGRLSQASRWDRAAMRSMFSGQIPSVGKNQTYQGIHPLIARESGWAPDLTAESRQYVGYTPQEYRRYAEQSAEAAGARWAKEHPSVGARLQPAPTMYGTALLDHQPQGEPLRNLYGDRNHNDIYEVLSGRAIAYMRELLTHPLGARRKPDRRRMEAATEQLNLVEAELRRVHRRAEKVMAAEQVELPARLVFQALDVAFSDREVLDALAANQRTFGERQELLIDRLEAARVQNAEFSRLLYEQATLNNMRDELRAELTQLWHDESTWEVVPDSAPPGSDQIDFTLDDLLTGPPRPEREDNGHPGGAVRNWILPVEQAWIVSVDRGTIVRQLAGDHLPARPEQRPWEREAVPVDNSLGLRYRRIWVEGINPTYWRAAERRRRLFIVLGEWPEVQGWVKDRQPTKRSLAPLILAEPFASALIDSQASRDQAPVPKEIAT